MADYGFSDIGGTYENVPSVIYGFSVLYVDDIIVASCVVKVVAILNSSYVGSPVIVSYDSGGDDYMVVVLVVLVDNLNDVNIEDVISSYGYVLWG